jgi:hypothetical protein
VPADTERPPRAPEIELRGPLRAPSSLDADYQPGRGVRLRSADERFELALGLWGQLRYAYRSLPGEERQLMTLPHARVSLAGHLFGEHNRYHLLLGLAPSEMEQRPAAVVGLPDPAVDTRGGVADQATGTEVVQQGPILELHFDFTHERDASVRAGQQRVPFTRQGLTDDRLRQLHDPALAEVEYGLDRDVGVMLYSDDLGGLDMLRYRAGIFIGEGRNPTPESIGAGDRGLLYVGRFEVLPVGRFDDDSESDFVRSAPRVIFGVSYALLQADATSPHGERFLGRTLGGAEETAIVDFNAHNFTADVLLKAEGASVQGAVHYRSFDGAIGARRGMGMLLSAGYLFEAPAIEPVLRFSLVRPSGVSALIERDALDVGLNYYMARNQLRLSAQYSHVWGRKDFSAGDEILELQLQLGL